MTFKSIAISSGHGLHVRGASGILDEVDEARRVVDRLTEGLKARGVSVKAFHDNTSNDQNENLNTIVNWHNKQVRDLDVSVHFNAHHTTDDPMGTEVCYVTQEALAARVANSIALSGFKDRGPKHRTDLFFLNKTDKPAILIETCFVDSTEDANIYDEEFENICEDVADALGGADTVTQPPEVVEPPETVARIDIQVTGDVLVYVNGTQVGTKG